MKVRIEIDTQTFVRFWLVVFGIGAVIGAIYLSRAALVIIGASVLLALALNRPVSALARRLPGRSRVGGTALAFIVVLMLLGAIIFLVIPPIAEQTTKFIDNAPKMFEEISRQWHGLGVLIDKYQLQPQFDAAMISIKASTNGWIEGLGGNILDSLGSALSIFTSIILALVLTCLFLIEGPVWMQKIWALYRDQETMRYHRSIAERMYSVFTGYVVGQLTISGIGSLCAGATVFILSMLTNVPANLALPTIAIAFTLSLIPMFGATIAGVLVSLLLAFNDLGAGIIFAIYFLVYQQIENNLISPNIQSKRVELTPLAVLVAVTIGLYVFGIAGGIISIPIAGCIKVLVEEYFSRAHQKRIEREKPIAKLVRKIKSAEQDLADA